MVYDHRSKVLEKLGVRTMINALNWSTTVGGTYLEPEVIEAIAEVSRTFVDMRDLTDKACHRLAELCKVDAAFITSGTAAGITMTVAACIAGSDPIKWSKLPFTEDPPINGRNQIVIQTNQLAYKEQYANGGGRLVVAGGPEGTSTGELEASINEKTAGIAAGYHYNTTPRGCIPYKGLASIAKKHDLPCFCDCAGAFPPYDNLHRMADEGFDLSLFSGGKGIRGPQDTGLILAHGQRGIELVTEIRKHSSPNMGFGRAYKVSKESIVGLVAALELVLGRDEKIEYQKQLAKAEYMAKHLESIPGICVSIVPNDGITYEHPQMARVPTVRIDIDKGALGLVTVKSIYEAMEKGEPGIFVRFPRFGDRESGPFSSKASVLLFTYFLRDGEEKIVAERMREVLTTRPWK